MKPLSPTLLAAQRSAAPVPHVEARILDFEQGVRRLHWTRLYAGAEPDNHHGLAFDGDGTMHRIRAGPANALLYQRIPSPGPGSPFHAWTTLATDCAGPCAITVSANNTIVIFYRNTANVIWRFHSWDFGVSWAHGALTLPHPLPADVASLAACPWVARMEVLCLAIRATIPHATLLAVSMHVGTLATVAHHEWRDGDHPLVATFGIGATYDPAVPHAAIVLSGRGARAPYDSIDLFRTRLLSPFAFAPYRSFLTSPVPEPLTYQFPDCHIPIARLGGEFVSAPIAGDTTRITAVENHTGIEPFARPLACHVVAGTPWLDTIFTEPRPLPDIVSTFGLRLQATPAFWWMSRPDGIWRAPRPADPPLIITDDILKVSLTQQTPATQGTLLLELDNSTGRYASPGLGPLASLRFRSEISLRLGYRTTAGPESVDSGLFWIDSWKFSSTPNSSLFTLHCIDGRGLLDAWSARHQMRWNRDAFDPHSIWRIIALILGRVGIHLTNTPPQPQSSCITHWFPDFAIRPAERGPTALRRLLALVRDGLIFRDQQAFTKNPVATEASSYSYGTPAPAGVTPPPPALHPILSGSYASALTTTRARTLGRSVHGDRILQEAFDPTNFALADILVTEFDPNMTTVHRTAERARTIIREASLRASDAVITVPTNVGQQLFDVVTVTDARCGITNQNFRVLGIETDFDRRKRTYTQKLTLGAP